MGTRASVDEVLEMDLVRLHRAEFLPGEKHTRSTLSPSSSSADMAGTLS